MPRTDEKKHKLVMATTPMNVWVERVDIHRVPFWDKESGYLKCIHGILDLIHESDVSGIS